MRALDRKLFRDLWIMRGQAAAIALVIAAGVAAVVMSVSTLDSLTLTRDRYYRDLGFAEVFASLKRAPDHLAERIAAIPGVDQVETRVVAPVTLDVEGFADPVRGRLVSVPEYGTWRLNRLYLREGRMVEPGREDEVIVSEQFAGAHGLRPGDRLAVVVKGRRKTLTLVGIALAPEHIFQVPPGAVFPDFERYTLLWMGHRPLATASDMEGAFNDVALTLSRGASLADVIDRLDDLLEPYGGLGAYGREDQVSYRFLDEEFKQLQQMGNLFSVIFLGISAFLLNIVMARLVATQREQIAALKAFGYANHAVGLHYAKLISLIVLAGVALGVAAGIWLGQGLSDIYMDYYRFPFMAFDLRPAVVVGAALVTLGAALLGTFYAVRRAALLPPAQAMRPEPPAAYRITVAERLGFQRWLSQPSRMILRHLERRPLKALLSVIAIALAGGIMMSGTFFLDAIDFMVEAEFGLAQREDLAVSFFEPASHRAVHELAALPGVRRVEPFRVVPARLRHEQRSERTTLQGFVPGADLHRTLDTRLRPVELPPEGLVLSDHLGKMLDVGPGDMLTVEVLEGSRPVRRVPVIALIQQYIGVGGYMSFTALNRLMGEGDAVSGVFLAVDRERSPDIYDALKEMPRVAGTLVHEHVVRSYYATIGDVVLTFVGFVSALAAVITFGVVYNSARITLAERGRELASLRVLGFTRGEVAYILLGELAVLTLAAVPLGFLAGWGMCLYFVSTLQHELFRIPLIVEPRTYALAATVVLASALVSGLAVRRRLHRLDLIAVLKTKE